MVTQGPHSLQHQSDALSHILLIFCTAPVLTLHLSGSCHCACGLCNAHATTDLRTHECGVCIEPWFQCGVLQFNQVKDYLSKGDAEVFTKCIVPFLKIGKHLEAGEIEAVSLAPLLDSCIANWLENQTMTQEMVLDSLEDAIEKYVGP